MSEQLTFKKNLSRDFPGSPGLRLQASTAEGTGLTPGRGTKNPGVKWCGQKTKTNQNKKTSLMAIYKLTLSK